MLLALVLAALAFPTTNPNESALNQANALSDSKAAGREDALESGATETPAKPIPTDTDGTVLPGSSPDSSSESSAQAAASTDPEGDEPSGIRTVRAENIMTKISARPQSDWYKPNSMKDCPNNNHVVQTPCVGMDGQTNIVTDVKGYKLRCPDIASVTCPYQSTKDTGSSNQKCVACIRNIPDSSRCEVRTRFVWCD